MYAMDITDIRGTAHLTEFKRDLDALIYKELLRIKSQAEENWKSIEKDVKAIMKNKANTEKKISDMHGVMCVKYIILF